MSSADLLKTARALALANPTKPTRANLTRSISTAYYAVFLQLAESCANTLFGRRLSDEAWKLAYRSLEHGRAKRLLNESKKLGLGERTTAFLAILVSLHLQRENADYDPYLAFSRSDALDIVDRAERALDLLSTLPASELRLLTAHLMFGRR